MSKPIGHTIHTFSSLESTNNYAMEQMRHNGMSHGEVVWAKHQAKGKGQRGNVWQSEKGKNLLFSICFMPSDLEIGHFFMFNQVVSVAIYHFLQSLGVKGLNIKWPNDILVNKHKIAGILTEFSTQNNTINYAVVGIGLNVNQSGFKNLPNKVTSMANLLEKEFQLNKVLRPLLCCIEERWQLFNKSPESIKAEYVKSLYQKDQWANYRVGSRFMEAKITGVCSQSGGLEVECRHGISDLWLREVVYL